MMSDHYAFREIIPTKHCLLITNSGLLMQIPKYFKSVFLNWWVVTEKWVVTLFWVGCGACREKKTKVTI